MFEKPKFTATNMAYVPYRDTKRAIRVILDSFPDAPTLPALTRSMKHMLEGIPCIVFDREKRQVLLDPSPEREAEIFEFYERYEAEDLDYFAITRDTAPWFYALLDKLKQERSPELRWVGFQTAGPVLLADVIKQRDGNPSFHNETLLDILIKSSSMKSRWLEKKIKQALPGVEVIAGLPETTLINFTSAGGGGTRETIIDAINRGFEGLNCLTWIHCCANIDWTLLTDSRVDVINFDAYQYADKIALYHKEFKAFLKRGGMLAWGIVPVTNELIEKETVKGLVERLERGIERLVSKGIDREMMASSSWLMPCCDTVLMTPENSDRAFSMTREISQIMRSKYGFVN
ncbi:MAG: hypothetical protein JRL30_09575 [Deltaproteobacteria bacterium]|nr:hypothetical protein [Deltaproteobacteria bacterium]